ncbi:tape measure protein [uncultured Draconibacterium sp.]|uniref:tape measure protein n=1 Tax=uncultured Draconibacterium sp. TaxID=1573823 RepID=UPI0029C7C9F3|nr:tape measure protein [uncultured Draconibacterium sp.]
MSSIYFESTYDDSKLRAGIYRSNQTVGEWARNAEKQGLIVERSFQNVTRAAGAYLSLRFAQQVGGDIISLRGEFQQLNIALETMLGSKAQADQMMSDIVTRALKSPFTVKEIATQTKQIIAMGIAVEDSAETIRVLGDIAAGTSVPLERLAINYGQVSALGRLQSREIRDFAMAGVPIVEELANMFGKTKEEVYALVEASEVGFKDVERAFQRMAGEGGKFYNLMEKQNASVTGQMSNLQDKIDLMLNDLGKSNEGIIYGGIEAAGKLVENYEEVLKVLKVLVVTYGSYKASLMAVAAYEAVIAKNDSVRAGIIEAKVAAIEKTIRLQDQEAAAAANRASVEQAETAKSLANENLKQAAMAKTVAAKEALALANTELMAAEEVYNAMLQKSYINATTSKEGIAARTAVENARAKVVKANAAVEKAVTQQTVVNSNIEAAAVKKAEAEKIAAKKAGIKVDRERLIASQTASAAEVRAARKASLVSKLTAGANPYILAAVGITTLITALSTYNKKAKEAAKITADFKTNLGKSTDEIKKQFKAVTDTKTGTTQHADAIQKVNDKYREYLPNLLTETSSLEEVKKAQDAVTSAMAKNLALKAQQDKLSDYESNVDDNMAGFYGQVEKATKKLNDVQKGQFNALIEDYKKTLAEQFKNFGYFPEFSVNRISDIFNDLTGDNLSGWRLSGLDMALKDLIRSEIELDDKTNSLKTTYDSYLKALGLTAEETEDSSEVLKTIQQQIDDTTTAIAEAQDKLKELRAPDSTATTEDIEKQEVYLKSLSEKLETLTGIKQKEVEKQIKSEEERLRAVEELADEELRIKQELEKSKVAAMRDGFGKQREQARINYEQELDEIDRQGKEYLKKLNESKELSITDDDYIVELPADIQEKLNQQKKNAEVKYNNEIVAINKAAADKIEEIWDSTTEAFISDVEAEITAINKKYDAIIEKNKDLSDAQKKAINNQRQAEIDEAKIQSALNQLDFEEEVEIRKAELEREGLNRSYKVEQQKIEIYRKFANLRIEELKKSKLKTAALDIEMLQLYLDELAQSEDDIKDDKRLKLYNDILDAVSSITAELVEQGALNEANAKNLDNTLKVAQGFGQIMAGNYVQGAGTWLTAIIGDMGSMKRSMSDFFTELRDEIKETKETIDLATSSLNGIGNSIPTAHIDLLHRKVAQLSRAAKDLNDQTSDINFFGDGNFGSELVWDLTKLPLPEYLKQLRGEVEILANKLLYGSLNEDQKAAIQAELEGYLAILDSFDSTVQELIGMTTNDLAGAMVEAFMAGEDAAEQWGQTVKGIIKNIILKEFTAQVLADPVNELVGTFVQNSSDGIQELDIANFVNGLDRLFEDSKPAFEAMIQGMEKYGFDFLDSSGQQQEALTGISRSITEETGSELVGQFYAMRTNLKAVEENTQQSTDYLMQSVEIQQQIANNTSHNVKINDLIDKVVETNKILKEGLA